jgi:hypothetical protein
MKAFEQLIENSNILNVNFWESALNLVAKLTE